MPTRRSDSANSEVRALFNHLVVYVAAIGVEYICRKLLVSLEIDLGLSEQWAGWLHRYMSFLLCGTLISSVTCTSGEVLSIGTRRLLRELAKLAKEIKAFGGALRSEGDE